MNVGMPAAFFVSEPKLCATRKAKYLERWEREAISLTPCNHQSNGCVRPASDTKDREVLDVLVVVNDKQQAKN
jgi:hypothetical protein